MVDAETLSIKFILNGKKITSIIDVVRWIVKIWTTFDSTIGHIQKVSLICKLNNLIIVIHDLYIFCIIIDLLDHSSKDHNLLPCYLRSSSMNNSQFDVISDKVDSFPKVLFYIESFNLLNVFKWELISNSSIWFETFTTNDENKLFVKLTNAECLSCFLEVR